MIRVMGVNRTVVALAVGALLALAGGSVRAQEFEPRTYAAAPVGLNFLAVGLLVGTGGNFGAGTDFDSVAASYQVMW